MEDSEIVALYWARDQQAISESADKYGTYCTSIARNILESPEDAEVCVSDTWFRAWNAMPPQRPSVLQAFFLEMGMKEHTVSYYASFTQGVYLVFSLLFAGAADRCRKTKRASTLLFFANGLSLLFQMTLCLLPESSYLFCVAAFAIGAVVNISLQTFWW